MSVKRELKHHTEVEPEWEPVMRLELNMSSVHSQMLDIVSSDDQLLIECILVASNILERQSRKNSVETDKKKFGGVQTKCIANPVETNPVSVHLQLHRILAALVGRACHVLSARNEDDWYGNLRIAFCHITYDQLMEPCLRVIVLAAQVIHANMWKRNGFSLVNQIHLYNRISGRVHMYNQDIAMLQICACKTPSMDEFLIHLLNKFHLKLLDWFEPRQEQHVSLEDLSKTYLALIEEFLYLVIVLLSERHTVLTEKFEKDADLQSELLHILLMGVHSHSEIVKKVTLVSINFRLIIIYRISFHPCHRRKSENVLYHRKNNYYFDVHTRERIFCFHFHHLFFIAIFQIQAILDLKVSFQWR